MLDPGTAWCCLGRTGEGCASLQGDSRLGQLLPQPAWPGALQQSVVDSRAQRGQAASLHLRCRLELPGFCQPPTYKPELHELESCRSP